MHARSIALSHLASAFTGRSLCAVKPSQIQVTRTFSHRLLSLFLLFVFVITLCDSASFYGLSYIKLPLQETKNSTDLEFRFKTHQLDAFLFLAAGSSDYFLVFLESGQLAVKINFGHGETYLATDELRLNDLLWHKVKLKLVKKHLSLTVDEKHNFLQRLKGESHELHIKYGIFLGGQDNFKSLYLGNHRPLRGCLADMHFNSIKNVLEVAVQQGISHNVAPDCDEQFNSQIAPGGNNTISFIEHDSFVLLPGLSSPFSKNYTKLSVHVELKTTTNNAIVLFSPSPNPYKRRYIAVELVGGNVRSALNDGSGIESSVQSARPINDGQWHQIDLEIGRGQLQLQVDGVVRSTQMSKSWSFSSQQFSSEMLIGGLSSRTDWTGLQSVMLSQNASLRGCLRNVRVNGKPLSLLDSLATHKIKSGKCKWHFLCAEADKSPCLDSAECVHSSFNKVKCVCNANSCIRPHFKHKSIMAISEKISQCRRTLKRLLVIEGGSAAISKDAFEGILMNLSEETQFLVIQQPKHGSLDIPPQVEGPFSQTFRWIDILRGDTVLYKHYGHSEHSDRVELRMQSNDMSLQAEQSHKCEQVVLVLPIDIIVVSANDDPSKSQHAVYMKMARHSKKVLPRRLLKIHKDLRDQKIKLKRDHPLEYSIVQMLNAGASYFERVSRPNAAIRDFTESELESQAIRFVHVDTSTATTSANDPVEVTLSVHAASPDRSTKIGELKLLISTYESELVEGANTGLMMAHNTAAIIGSSNLSFSIANETDQSQLIKYEIVSGPKHGIVQKLRASSNQWTNATHFSQRQLDRGKVRYVHLQDRPKQDQVQLKVSLSKQQVSRNVSVVITFVDQLKVVSSGPNRCYLRGEDKEVLIDSSKLSYRTEPVRMAPAEIRFTLLSAPLCGGLYLAGDGEKQGQLHISSSFSQKDINEGKVLYVKNTSHRCAEVNVDSFDFEVAPVIDSNATQVATFSFDIGQTNHKQNVLINSKLIVNEGESSTIDANHLYFTAENEDDVVVKIIKQPKNGVLRLMAPDGNESRLVPQVSLSQIKSKRLQYKHDDSENETDDFEFEIGNSANESIVSGTFFIEVTMKNDNAPTRVVDKPFNVIRNGEKPLLGSDICYKDKDKDTTIFYTKTHIPNGSLYFSNGTSAENGFTQADLDQGKIRFRHNGSDIGKAILWVTDGQFYLSGVLEIRANDPYVRLLNNTGIVVKYGMNSLITTANLAIETNLDLTNKSSILFKITSEPKFGQILVNDKMANQFTLEELEDEMVQFESTVFEDEATPLSKIDGFSFRILTSGDMMPIGRAPETFDFSIRIFPPNYYNLELVHHNNLTVLEGKTALISSKILLTKHSELNAYQIVYRVVEKPSKGHLINSKHADLSDMAKRDGQSFTFSQSDIDSGLIAYNQNVKFDLDPYGTRYWDKLVFEVGSDFIFSGNKTLFIEVIPKLIMVITNNITVSEGQAAILSKDNLAVAHPFYERLVDQFIVIEKPKFGSITYESPSGMPLTAKSFTAQQLKEGKISYRQDSSEVTNDWLTIVARSNLIDKESLPATVHISISSVNDEAPKIVNNSIAWVWQEGTVQIDRSLLASIDRDNTPQQILYTTYLSTNGYLIDSDTNTTIDAFTQEAINAGKVHFVHVGSEDGSFQFHVTDGENSGITSRFIVKLKPRKLYVAANEKLLVSPGMAQSITQRHLRVTLSSDLSHDSQREFVFRIVKAPSYGRIVLEGFKHRAEQVLQFTQKNINENEVLYEQNAPITEPLVNDRIVFNVESEGLPTLENVHFMVEIAVQNLKSVVASNINEMVQISPLLVKEGHFSAIGTSQINLTRLLEETHSSEKLCLMLLATPEHGLILKNGITVMVRECVPFEASRNGSLVYMHDNSNTFNDCISLQLMFNGISLFNLTVPVKIKPVNDEFPVVINRAPKLKAVFGSQTVVTNQTLRARDDDGPMFDLIYQIRKDSNVTRESFFLLRRSEREDVPVYEFTQSDVDSNRLFFSHKGKELHLIYWFRVKDDREVWCEDDESVDNFEAIVTSRSRDHCTPFYPLKVVVTQLSLQLLNHTTVQLLQGDLEAPITRANLATSSQNARPNFIRYKITKGPFHGYISVDGEQNREFSQEMIDQNLVKYHVMNMSSEDYFLVDIVQPNSNFYEKSIYDVNVKIAVKPLIKALRPFLVTSPGQQALLSYEYLDASALALHSDSNPVFKLLAPPRYGYFKLLPLLHFGENEAASPIEGITEFTHNEIIDNRIAYVAQSNLDLSYPNEMLIDVIHYELSAAKVQDAHGILVVNVFNNRSYIDLDTLLSAEKKLSIGLSKQVLLIISTIMISLVLLVSLVVIMRISSCKKAAHLEQNSTKSLPSSDNLEQCARQYSSTSLRQTDCSSRSSLDSAAVNHHHQAPLRPEDQIQPRGRPLQAENGGDCPSDLLPPMRRPHGPRSDKSEDISPLPPPSLYFINDSSFDDARIWSKAAFRFEMQERPLHSRRISKEQVNRSSGDGTSHSDSPQHSTVKVTCKGKPYEQFVHMGSYLSSYKDEGPDRDQPAFYTLNTRSQRVKGSPTTQMKNQYWI